MQYFCHKSIVLLTITSDFSPSSSLAYVSRILIASSTFKFFVFRLNFEYEQITMNKNITILIDPDAILSNILISANLFKNEAKIDGYHLLNGRSSRILFEFKCLKNRAVISYHLILQ